jgi:hypothetical protein
MEAAEKWVLPPSYYFGPVIAMRNVSGDSSLEPAPTGIGGNPSTRLGRTAASVVLTNMDSIRYPER